jgi:MFS superfamily sulfate permease-like transporter
VLAVLTLLFLTGLFQDLPEPTLAAVVIAALIERSACRATGPGASGPRANGRLILCTAHRTVLRSLIVTLCS